MFGIGLSELAIIALVVVVFIKPEDLPAFFRAAGRLYAKARRAYQEVATIRDDFVRAVNEAASVEEPVKSGPDRIGAGPAGRMGDAGATGDAKPGGGSAAGETGRTGGIGESGDAPGGTGYPGRPDEPGAGQAAYADPERVSGGATPAGGEDDGAAGAETPPERIAPPTASKPRGMEVGDLLSGPGSRPSGPGSAGLPPRLDRPDRPAGDDGAGSGA